MADSPDFEKALCGAIFLEPAVAVVQAVKGGVSADWFTVGRWRLAWSAAVSLWRAGGSDIDANLIVAEAKRLAKVNPDGFEGDELTLNDCTDAIDSCAAASCASGYIAQLKGAMILREMRKAIERTFAAAGKMDPEYACSELVNRLYDILSRTVVAKTTPFADLVDASVRRMREAHRIRYEEGRNDYVPGAPTPWWALTAGLNGLLPGFHIIGARTSVGKTSFALQLVRFFAEKGLNVGFDSLDMNTRSFVDRFIAESSRVSLYKANFGWADNGDLARIEGAAEKIRQWPVTVMVEYDVDHLFNWCRVRKSAGLIDILFVDFVQLLSYRGADRATDTGRMTRVSKTLKRIVNELDIPIIGLSQLNRDCERDGGREPTKADLRESGALEQDATTVWLLYHDKDVLAKFREEARAGSGCVMGLAGGQKFLADKITPTFVKVDKNQNGPLVTLPFIVYSNYFTWMLADYKAEPIVKTENMGAITKTTVDNYPLFKRVHADWRHNEFEKDIERWGALLPEDVPPENDAKRAEKYSQTQQPPPLPALEDLPKSEPPSVPVMAPTQMEFPVDPEEDEDDFEDDGEMPFQHQARKTEMMEPDYPMKKRGRGRPRKAEDPHRLPEKSCANCRRKECTSGLNERMRKLCTDRACINHKWEA